MLSKKARYSIHALLRLAREPSNNPVQISRIASDQNIPKKFLESILLELKNEGILASKKGKGGGYYLIRKPEDINLADIIRHFDGAIALLACATYKYYQPCNHCKDELICGVRSVIRYLRDTMVNFLKGTSLIFSSPHESRNMI